MLINKKLGNSFENLFAAGCSRVKVACTRMPDGCKRVGPQKLIPVKTPFDWIVSHEGRTALLDTKTCIDFFAHSHIVYHQVAEMVMQSKGGALAGYVVWSREINLVFYVPASVLIVRQTRRGSVDPTDASCISLGPINSFDIRRIFTPEISAQSDCNRLGS